MKIISLLAGLFSIMLLTLASIQTIVEDINTPMDLFILSMFSMTIALLFKSKVDK